MDLHCNHEWLVNHLSMYFDSLFTLETKQHHGMVLINTLNVTIQTFICANRLYLTGKMKIYVCLLRNQHFYGSVCYT